MAPDIKAALKEAKCGIKDSNFEQVVKYCKIVLKHERNNYQALVMFARACQEMQKYEDSKKALLLASNAEPDTAVAWQGLATLMDLQPQLSTLEEAVSVYTKLSTIIDSGPKHVSFLRKLASAQDKAGHHLAAADTYVRLLPLITNEGKDAERELAQAIVNILAPMQKTLSKEKFDILLGNLHSLLNDSVLGNNETNYKLFLSLTYQAGDSEKVIEAASKMASIFPTAYPLEWIARVFVENNLPWKKSVKLSVSWEECGAAVERLLKIYPASLWGNLAVGLDYLGKNDLQNAIAHYSKACECSTSQYSNSGGQPLIWWRLILEARTQVKDWPAVDSIVDRVLALLRDSGAKWPVADEETEENVCERLLMLRAEALMKMEHTQHFNTALSALRQLNTASSYPLIVQCLLHLDLKDARNELITKKDSMSHVSFELLHAQLLFAEKDLQSAKQSLEKLLQNDPNNHEGLILLGRIYQETNDSNASLTCLLRAAKLASTEGKAFLYLGHHYRRSGDDAKAVKCYQRAYALQPTGEKEGASLSDMYRKTDDHDKNFALLTAATQSDSCGGAWAWFRLGLHYLAQHDAQRAISSLQRCLQLHHNHRQALESLGDAYLARGSYVAAQKVHERVLTIDPTAVYPRCQIAKIQLCVGEPQTAVAQYEAVLRLCSDDSLRSVCLLGLAQAHVALAGTASATNFHDNTLNHCQRAIAALDGARVLQPQSVSVWKCLGDACCILHRLPRSLRDKGILLPARMTMRDDSRPSDDTARVPLATVLQLATKCYGVALQLADDKSALWHDLGLSYYLRARHECQQEGREAASEGVTSLMHRATNCLKKSLNLSPQSCDAWNSLGLVSAHQAVNDRALAQHCFIRSVQLKPGTSNWTHLGALYLVCDEATLAHQAFCQAQALDHRCVSCWTGQALVAESVQHYDAADLYRHCCTLGVHPEACLGHSHHVMLTLTDQKSVNKRPTPSMMALAADAMLFYSREFDCDVQGLNLAGLCLEEVGMMHTAADLYETALVALTQHASDNANTVHLLDCVRSNYGRVLTSLGRVQEAAQQVLAITEPDFASECILALACLKGEDYETGYTKYMSALHWLAQSSHHKVHVLVALACLQYKFNKIQDAKTLLFESCSEGGGCVAGIVALGALGLLEGDSTLITAALKELQPHRNTEQTVHHVAFLTAAQAILTGDGAEAKRVISRALMCQPQSPHLWRLLAWVLLTAMNTTSVGGKRSGTPLKADKMSHAIVTCASNATTLSQHSSGTCLTSRASTSSSFPLSGHDGSLRVLGYLTAGRRGHALKEAQRVLLMYPGDPHSWAALLATGGGKDAGVKRWRERCGEAMQVWIDRQEMRAL